MAFVFNPNKNQAMISKIVKANQLYKEEESPTQKKNKPALVPFLSTSEKLLNKINETPGPGQYNIQRSPENFIHKQYIKKNIERYKDGLNEFVNLMNNFNVKIIDKITPGPGDYNPGENNNFGAKAKKLNIINNHRNNLILYQNENMMRNMYFFNNLENEKTIPINNFNINNKSNTSIKDNTSNISNTHHIKTKKLNSTNNKIFKKLLFAYSKYKEEVNTSSTKDVDYSHPNEAGLDSFNQTNKLNNSNSLLTLDILKKNNSSSNIFRKKIKTKIFRTIHDHERIKELSEQKRLDMKDYSAKSNYYLEKYLTAKIFSQLPGPGYYFSKPMSTSHAINNYNNNIDNIKKTFSKKLMSKILAKNKSIDIEEQIRLKSENPKMKRISLSKTMYELKNDIIKKDFEKVKEVYIRNKYNDMMNKLIKSQQIEDKEIKNIPNNNKEIQESGYPIKYKKYHLSNKEKNNSININSHEKRFVGHTGWEKEIIKNENPGPGEYEVDINDISKRNKDFVTLSFLKGLHIPKDRKLFTDEIKDTNPPVGSYQSEIFNSIEFNNQCKSLKVMTNPIRDGFQRIIKARTKKRIEDLKLSEKETKSLLGPCSYFNNYNSINSNNINKNKKYKDSSFREIRNKRYTIKEPKLKYKIDYRNERNTFEYNSWIKKTFNASLV